MFEGGKAGEAEDDTCNRGTHNTQLKLAMANRTCSESCADFGPVSPYSKF